MTETFGFGSVLTEQIDTGIPAEVSETSPDSSGWQDYEGSEQRYEPRITPGLVVFRFEADVCQEPENGTGENNRSTCTLANGKVPRIIYTAHVQTAELPSARLLKNVGGAEVSVRFNEASGFVSQTMKDNKDKATGKDAPISSDMSRLYTALGLREECGPAKNTDQARDTIMNCGSRLVHGALGWKASTKLADGSFETFIAGRKLRKKEKAWPLDEQGNLAVEVTFSNGDRKVGREQIVAVYPPRRKKE